MGWYQAVEEEGGVAGDGVVGRVEEGADGFGASGAFVVAAAFLRAGGNGGLYGIHGRISRACIFQPQFYPPAAKREGQKPWAWQGYSF